MKAPDYRAMPSQLGLPLRDKDQGSLQGSRDFGQGFEIVLAVKAAVGTWAEQQPAAYAAKGAAQGHSKREWIFVVTAQRLDGLWRVPISKESFGRSQ